MAQPEHNNPAGAAAIAEEDDDATIVQPLFTEEAAETARPVVPLAAEPADISSPGAYAPRPAGSRAGAFGAAPRRSWLVALILISALVGGALGGVLALRFYQKRQQAPASQVTPGNDAATAAAPAIEQPQEAPQEQQQQVEAAAPSETQTEPQPSTNDAEPAAATADQKERKEVAASEAVAAAPSARTERAESAPRPAVAPRPAESPERAAAPVNRREELRRPAQYEARESGTRKRGKRGEANGGGDDDPEPRLVDRIVYSREQRRAARRAERRAERNAQAPASRDRVRAIFEGAPPE